MHPARALGEGRLALVQAEAFALLPNHDAMIARHGDVVAGRPVAEEEQEELFAVRCVPPQEIDDRVQGGQVVAVGAGAASRSLLQLGFQLLVERVTGEDDAGPVAHLNECDDVCRFGDTALALVG